MLRLPNLVRFLLDDWTDTVAFVLSGVIGTCFVIFLPPEVSTWPVVFMAWVGGAAFFRGFTLYRRRAEGPDPDREPSDES